MNLRSSNCLDQIDVGLVESINESGARPEHRFEELKI